MFEDADRPQFTLTLTMSEAFALKDASACFMFVSEGDFITPLTYVEDGNNISSFTVTLLEDIRERLELQMRPVIRAHAKEIRELAERHRQREIDDYNDSH